MRMAVNGPDSLSSGRASRASSAPVSLGSCMMGGSCSLSALLVGPWRWLTLAVDYRRLTCAALLLGGIGGTLYWVALDYVGAPVFKIVGWSLIVSRCTAMLMLPTFSLCLLAACRRTMTVLRQTPLKQVIPFDDAISFHQGAGVFGVFLAVMHSVCHIINFISAQKETTYSVMYLHAAHAAGGLVWNPAITATGGLMLLTIFIALPFALKWPKQACWLRDTLLGQVLNNFTTFYISHQIFFFVFVVLFMLHPVPSLIHVKGILTWLPIPYSWMWMAWPFALYSGERLYGHFRAQTWDTKIMGACILDPGVLTLEISKPPSFSYRPGQYIFVQCGDISRYEWHPFSLTSAPADNFLQVHIKDAGDWTGALHAKFRASMQVTHSDKRVLVESLRSSLARRLSRDGEHAGRLQTLAAPAKQVLVTSRKQELPDHLEIVKGTDKDFHHTDSAKDFCTMQHRAFVTSKGSPPMIKDCVNSAFVVDPREASLKPISLCIPKADLPADPAVPDQLEAEVADLISHNLVVQRPLAASVPEPKQLALGSDPLEVLQGSTQPSIQAQCCAAAPAVPSGSYIAYELSTEYGSELQMAQAQRTRESTEAWKGMPVQSILHDIPEHVSAEGLQRIQALVARFGGARHAPPAEAPRIIIDGPFGAPAQEHAKFSQVLLIGMGIGITPMLSIMRDALHRLVDLPASAYGLEGDAKSGALEHRRAYMHWVVRDPRAGGWLKSEFEVMSLLDSSGHIFRSHVHVTGECPLGVCPSLAWRPCPAEHPNVELSRGRPDFEAILRGLQVTLGKGRVGVFLCGPPPVKRELRDLCTSLNKEGSTVFCFHAEKFF